MGQLGGDHVLAHHIVMLIGYGHSMHAAVPIQPFMYYKARRYVNPLNTENPPGWENPGGTGGMERAATNRRPVRARIPAALRGGNMVSRAPPILPPAARACNTHANDLVPPRRNGNRQGQPGRAQPAFGIAGANSESCCSGGR
jgi:hypothetical protein